MPTKPVLLLHGFTQTRSSFDPLVAALRKNSIASRAIALAGHEVGHGPERQVVGDLWAGADNLAATSLANGPHHVLGYSMGARLALHVALAYPDALHSLILIGGTAGLDDATARAERRRADEERATLVETIGVEAFLEQWLAHELFATLPNDPERMMRRASNTAAGLASSLRFWGTGTMEPPLWNRLSSISIPTLVLAGEYDAKFTDLGRRMSESIGGNASFEAIPGAGHAAHIERPDLVAASVASWRRRND